MDIRIASFEDRNKVYALRFEVFVDEQNVPPEIELDSDDEIATHIIAEENGETVGCGRILFDGNSAHIGRLAVKKSYRNKGVGFEICRFIINYCQSRGYKRIWLNSQLHAKGFYEKLGFKAQGDIFTEAGIEHIKMEIKNIHLL